MKCEEYEELIKLMIIQQKQKISFDSILIYIFTIIIAVLSTVLVINACVNKVDRDGWNITFAAVALLISLCTILITFNQFKNQKPYDKQINYILFSLLLNNIVNINSSNANTDEKNKLRELLMKKTSELLNINEEDLND